MNEFFRLMLVPTLICAVCAALLGFVNAKTKGPIAEGAAARELKAAATLLSTDSAEKVGTPDGTLSGFAVRDASGAIGGIAVQGMSANGYGGDLRILVAFDAGGKVMEYQVLQMNETPGLGSKVDKEPMHERIRNASFPSDWTVTKDGGPIEAITAATVSSRALMEALRDAEENRARLLAALLP
ncbi:MAG: RnfABCDGE type electron transport complex subunit G [Kiritimatiellia bacterium]|jgi:electron transport complex protein RnfG